MEAMTELMDKFYLIVKKERSEDAVEALMRAAGSADAALALEAMARVLVIQHARAGAAARH